MLSGALLAGGCGLLATCASAIPLFEDPTQVPLQHGQEPLNPPPTHEGNSTASKKRPLHGRFLHMTDFHPDPFYKVYSSTSQDSACHRNQGPAGIYGAETSECDSPFDLVNQTLTWIGDNLRDSIDFIVWTGDSARHDNDEEIPRTVSQVTELNEFMVESLYKIFGKPDNGDEEDRDPNNDFVVPIIPTFGNNDVLPHNIMVKGPNRWTRTYSKVWRQFIPEPQKHSFETGGWFFVEVIPNRLAVFSLNTLYFFDSNSGVDGCAARNQPGYQQMEWLRIQLQFLRQRGMKAILSGHVPPARTETKSQWDETCWQKYALWLERYRDVVVGGLWGHMNYDHFFLQDFEEVWGDAEKGRMRVTGLEEEAEDDEDGVDEDDEEDDDEEWLDEQDVGEVHEMLSSDYFTDLRNLWSEIPTPPKAHKDTEVESQQDYLHAISDEERPDWEVEQLVNTTRKGKGKGKKSKGGKGKKGPSKYPDSIGGEFAERYAVSFVSPSVVPNLFPTIRVYEYNISGLEASSSDKETSIPDSIPTASESDDIEIDDFDTSRRKKSKNHKSKKPKKTKFRLPSPPSDTAPPGPAYSPQPLSLLKYTQYYANLTRIDNDFTSDGIEGVDSQGPQAEKWSPGKHHGKHPHPRGREPEPKKFEFEVLYDTQEDAVYGLQDLTVPRVLELARRIGAFREPSSFVSGIQEIEALEGEGEGEGEDEDAAVDDDEDDPEGEDENEDAMNEDREDEMEASEKKKHHKGKKHKKHGKHGRDNSKRNLPWYTFISRAFVGTLDPQEVKEAFGH